MQTSTPETLTTVRTHGVIEHRREPSHIVVVPCRGQVVLDTDVLQRCPNCMADRGLRLCAISPYAVMWCRCGRAWPYPTLTYRWVVTHLSSPDNACDELTWPRGTPTPAAVLDLFPGLDVLADLVDLVHLAGPVDSHRRLRHSEVRWIMRQEGAMLRPLAA